MECHSTDDREETSLFMDCLKFESTITNRFLNCFNSLSFLFVWDLQLLFLCFFAVDTDLDCCHSHSVDFQRYLLGKMAGKRSYFGAFRSGYQKPGELPIDCQL